ncbi:MAG: glutamate--tRNA ligase family protein [archaeon]
MKEIKVGAFRYAVKNAFEHDGKANVGSVVGKVKALFPDANLKDAMPVIQEAVKEANSLSKSDLKKKHDEFAKIGWELKHESKEKTLPELDWLAPGEKLIMRMAPNPSGAMHFGHARPAILSDEYVKKYGGKLILRFDDTDPKVKTPMEGAEEEFKRDFKWLGIEYHEISRSSDRLDRYYEIIEKLLTDNMAYVCSCESEKWRELIWKKKGCPCREKKPAEQLALWKKMLAHEIKEEQAVVRIKTDLNNPDPSERDWWAAKIVDEVNHTNPRVKNKHVWPSYNLACAVDDYDMKINFILRGQEHMTNADKQKFLFDHFGWKVPVNAFNGKISKLGDMVLSKSKIKLLMDKQGLTRDDDPRLATIKAFRRRGILPATIRKIILACGLSISEVKISVDMIGAFNREFLGEVAEYPMFEEAAELEVMNVAPGEGESYGEKIVFEKPIVSLLVDKKELKKHKAGDMVRLKKAFNLKLSEVSEFGAKGNFVSYSKTEHPIISWMTDPVDVEILMGDGALKRGFSSGGIIKEKGMVRFEGIGFCHFDEGTQSLAKFVFGHK